MSQKIRQGNDIDIRWSLLDGDEQPYDLTGKDIAVELNVGTKKVRIKEFDVSGNTLHFIYYGKDQKYLGSYALKYIENGDKPEMITFDTKDAFALVEHSWLAVDEGETPETIQIEVVTVSSELDMKTGPRGYSAYEIAVQNGFVGTEEEWLASLKGEQGEQGEQGIEGPQGEKGDKGDRGEQGPQGDPGSDAEVTRQNIERALGYVPASPDSVAAKYTKPYGGIPMTDLNSALKNTINGKQDKAVRYYPDLNCGLIIRMEQNDSTIRIDARIEDNYTREYPRAEMVILTSKVIEGNKVIFVGDKESIYLKKIQTEDATYLFIDGFPLPGEDDVQNVFYVAVLSGNSPSIKTTTVDEFEDAEISDFTNIEYLYAKPEGGIPASDMASGVLTSLGKADTALQPVSGATNGNLAGLNSQGKVVDSGKKPSDFAAANLVPAQASPSNQLADKNFVNSSIQTETATFRGNYDTWEDVPDTGDAWENAPDNNDYLVVRDASNYAPIWDNDWAGISGYPGFIVGDIVTDYSETLEKYVLCRCIADINYDEEPEESSPANNSTHFEIVTSNPNYEGTWRFKYPDSGEYDKYNWLPEYQVNEKPLTAAQLAALNSNITDTKVAKLDGLPTRAELTQEEQALDKIFIATKDVTTPAQVASARVAGKVVIVIEGNDTYILSHEDNNEYFFSAVVASGTHYYLKLNKSTGTWSWNSSALEKTSNKVTSLSPSSTDTEYPSAKCVYDALYENAIISLAVNSAGTAFDLIGLKVTVTNADTSEQISEQTWQGSPLVVRIKAGVNYIVSVQSHPDYVTPVAQSFKSELASIRAITFEYVYSSVMDLSYRDTDGQKQAVQNTANSYIARIAGDYKFPAVYGNAIKNGAANADAYIRRGSTYTADFVNYKGIQITSPYIETDTGESIASAVLLWQTGANLISNVSFANGYVSFTVNSIPTENGLAVLAVKDANGDIMWSWTIWLTTDTLTAEKFTNYTEVDYYLMLENLFCIWNEQRTNCGTGMIQWGRKDVTVPNAPGGSSQMAIYDIDGNTITPGTALGSVIGVFGTDNDQSADKTVANSIKNPGMFFTRYDSTNNNWNNLAWFNNFWNAAETSSASSADNQDTAIKTIYDPCPFGWILPAGRAFTGFTTTGGGTSTASQFNVVGSWSNGWNFKRNSEDATGNKFIASGYRASGSGAFTYVGSNGGYWSFAPNSRAGARDLSFIAGYVNPQYDSNRSYGFAVRPSRE